MILIVAAVATLVGSGLLWIVVSARAEDDGGHAYDWKCGCRYRR